MRDTRKSKAYFLNYIAYEEKRIEKQREKLKISENPRSRNNLLLHQLNLLVSSFSNGDDINELRVVYRNICDTALGVERISYSDTLLIYSFAIILEDHSYVIPLIERSETEIASDKLLSGFVSFIKTGTAVWDGLYRFPLVYDKLDAVIMENTKHEKEHALLAYLETWYENSKDCAWYDTVDNPNDVYYGYWSFESAAIAKIFDLDLAELTKSEYFPVI